jgi:hypothetical protein
LVAGLFSTLLLTLSSGPLVVIDWRTLAEQVDREVDAQFGEPITLTPMRAGSDYAASERDPTRPVANATGVLVRPVGRVVEGSGEATRGGDFLSRVVETEMILSVREDAVSAARPRKGDRVAFLDRGIAGEIAFIERDVTDRLRMHLVRIRE